MNIDRYHGAGHIVAYLFAVVLISGVCSCEGYVRRKKADNLVKEWTGKTILFDREITCGSVMPDTPDTICSRINNRPYKILLYLDAKGCASCKIQTEKWKSIIAEADSTLPGLLSFKLYFHPKKNESHIYYALRLDKFDYPVYIDRKDRLNELNKFPMDPDYQCFLLDRNNRVVLIGNPFTNPRIWKLCKKIISENQQFSECSICN
jgi:hypothetical protein